MIGDWIAWIISLLFGVAGYYWLVKKYPANFRHKNFLGQFIPASAGVVVVLSAEAADIWLLKERYAQSAAVVETAMIAAMGFGVLGLIDDLFGDRSISGLKGHFKALLVDRRFTTGALKAVGGAAAALAIGYLVHPENAVGLMLTALIIALSANASNLTDTRPGRSLTLVLLFALVGAAAGFGHFTFTKIIVFAPPFVISAGLYFFDRNARLMIGDSGSNALGALVGLLWTLVVPSWGQWIFLSLLVWFHLWTEKYSLSRYIDHHTWLRVIDAKIGLRS